MGVSIRHFSGHSRFRSRHKVAHLHFGAICVWPAVECRHETGSLTGWPGAVDSLVVWLWRRRQFKSGGEYWDAGLQGYDIKYTRHSDCKRGQRRSLLREWGNRYFPGCPEFCEREPAHIFWWEHKPKRGLRYRFYRIHCRLCIPGRTIAGRPDLLEHVFVAGGGFAVAEWFAKHDCFHFGLDPLWVHHRIQHRRKFRNLSVANADLTACSRFKQLPKRLHDQLGSSRQAELCGRYRYKPNGELSGPVKRFRAHCHD